MADNFLTRKVGPLPAWGWAAAGAGVYLIWRLRKSQAASSTASTSTGATAGSGYGDYASGTGETASLTTPSGFQYSGPASYLSNPSLQSLFANPTPAVAVTPGAGQSSGVAGFGPASLFPGYTELGIETGSGPQAYSGYNVSGGAPVFYAAPGQTPTQGTGQAKPGSYVLVPSEYNPFVSTTPTHTL